MILSDHWYKNAIIYSLSVRNFQDGNGDGMGDFPGLTRRLDYLVELGVNFLWLLPFYRSPMCDDGYDVSDYYSVDSRYGSLGDFVEFIREADARGIRVLVDLVVNHTSDQHPWFQASRSSPDSPFRNWYVWRKHKPDDQTIAFPGEQQSTWAWDDQAQAYYLHHFYPFQPDLNLQHPAVRDEINRITGFWLQLGVSGFRVDAATFLIEDKSERTKGGDESHFDLLNEMREFVDRRRGDAVFLAEANVPPDRVGKYFGDAHRFQMVFAFRLTQMMFLSLAKEDAATLGHALEHLPPLPQVCQWGTFLRNHDDLSLDQLSRADRNAVLDALAPDPDARIFGHSIRRRLAPMLADQRKTLLLFSLLMTLPGTPVLRYGEGIGMGDDLSLHGREAVRTVMQWTDEPNAGFSPAAPDQLQRPIIREGPYGYPKVNVRQQERDPASLLSQVRQMIRLRRVCAEFGWGQCHVVHAKGPLLVHAMRWNQDAVIAVHNLSGRQSTLQGLPEPFRRQKLHDPLNGETDIDPATPIILDPWGYRWLRIGSPIIAPAFVTEPAEKE